MSDADRTKEERNPDGLSELIRTAAEGEETVFEVARDIIGENEDGSKQMLTAVSVSRRKLQQEKPLLPDRAESPARAHTFHSAEGFAAYLTKYGDEDVVVLANVLEGYMKATLDEKAKHGFEVIRFAPVIHPLFGPWYDLLGDSVRVKTFAAFVMENRRAVVQPDGKEIAMLFRQVHASIKTEIAQGIGDGMVNGMMVTSRIQNKDRTEAMSLPDMITIRVPIYVGTAPVDIEIDLLVMADQDRGVTVRPSAAMVLQAKTDAFAEMVMLLEQNVKGAIVAFGAAGHKPWEYIG